MSFYIYKDAINEWRWHLKSPNGNKIANSGEGYKNRSDCLYAISLVLSCNANTPIYDLTQV